jgi:hypothetical protein
MNYVLNYTFPHEISLQNFQIVILRYTIDYPFTYKGFLHWRWFLFALPLLLEGQLLSQYFGHEPSSCILGTIIPSKILIANVHIDTGILLSLCNIMEPPQCSSGQSFWLQIQRPRVRSPALPDFLRSTAYGTGSTQPREDNWGGAWIKK